MLTACFRFPNMMTALTWKCRFFSLLLPLHLSILHLCHQMQLQVQPTERSEIPASLGPTNVAPKGTVGF